MDRVNILLDFFTPSTISFRNNISAPVSRKNKNVEILDLLGHSIKKKNFCFLILKLFPKIVVRNFSSWKLFTRLEVIYNGFNVRRSEKSYFYLSYIYLNLVNLKSEIWQQSLTILEYC